VVEQQLHLHEKVEMTDLERPVCVEPSTSIRQVLGLLKQQSAGSCLVCSQDKLLGIFTERDATKLLSSGGDLNGPIETVMTRSPQTARTTDSVASAIEKMARGGYRRLPVVNETGKPVGVIGVPGIVHFLVQHFPQTVYNLPPHPNPVMPEREGA
jgi:CBS domain-containing protein